jgi:hypothetical protein
MAFTASLAEGLPNFYPVNDQLFRGAQPSSEGFPNLAKMGVKTVLDLRESGGRSAAEGKIVEADGMRYVSMPIRGHVLPTEDRLTKMFALFNDKSADRCLCTAGEGGSHRDSRCLLPHRHDDWDN